MHQVAIADYLQEPVELERNELKDVAEVHCLGAKDNVQLVERAQGIQGMIVFHEVSVPREVIAQLKECRILVRCGVGYDSIDIQAAGERGIPVCNVPDYGVDEVSDHAIALMLACVRGFGFIERDLRRTLQPWDCQSIPPVPRLAGATFGVIGLGRLGMATLQRAKGFRMKVLAHDPYLRPGLEKVFDVPLVDLKTLMSQCDVISLHTPLTDETHHLINSEALSWMKPTAYLINTSRGAVIDVEALAEALESKKIAGAGIDVLPFEPPTENHPLVKLWRRENPAINLMLTPHVAFYSVEALIEMRQKAAREIRRFLLGQPLKNCVNLEFLKPKAP